jgi:hypothetical protein
MTFASTAMPEGCICRPFAPNPECRVHVMNIWQEQRDPGDETDHDEEE